MYIAVQFSVFMVNKPGVLAQVLVEFARAKINIIAMTMMDSVEQGVMRVVFAASDRAREVLSKLNMPYSETEVLCVNLTNKSGALAVVAEKLAKAHINIAYAYCTAGAKGGRTTGYSSRKAKKHCFLTETRFGYLSPITNQPYG
jgi:hypothetical protein